MRKILIFSAFLLILAPPAVAAEFSTVLHTSDLNEEFDLTGDITTNINENRKLDLLIKYRLEFINENYNSTDVDFFEIRVESREEILESKKTGSFGLDLGGNRTGYIEIVVDKPALVEELTFHANHTALIRSNGEKVDRSTSSAIDYSPKIPEQEVKDIRTNSTQAHRGGKIYINGSHSNIASLNISGHMMELDKGEIRGWIDLPEGLEEGRQKIPLDIRTGWGKRFKRDIELEIINRPPNITLDYPKKVKRGENLYIKVSAVDDVKLRSLAVNFRGKRYKDIEKLELPTENLDNGSYRFKSIAIDSDGAKTERNSSFRVVEELKGENTRDDENPEDSSDEKNKEDENEEEEPAGIPVIRQFRITIESGIRFIIGLF